MSADYSPTWNEIDDVIAKYTTVDMAKRLLELEHAASRGPSERTYDLKDMETFCTLAASKMYEACLQAVQGEHLSGESDHADDIAYDNAVRDCENAIKALCESPATANPIEQEKP